MIIESITVQMTCQDLPAYIRYEFTHKCFGSVSYLICNRSKWLVNICFVYTKSEIKPLNWQHQIHGTHWIIYNTWTCKDIYIYLERTQELINRTLVRVCNDIQVRPKYSSCNSCCLFERSDCVVICIPRMMYTLYRAWESPKLSSSPAGKVRPKSCCSASKSGYRPNPKWMLQKWCLHSFCTFGGVYVLWTVK